MNQDWDIIAETLRREIAGYGGLLHFLAQQEEALFAHDSAAILRLSADIEAHIRTLDECRGHREELVARFATAMGQPATRTLRALLPQFSLEARPLMEALVKEVNVLVYRVRRASRHNHTLLARAVDTHQQMLRALRPDSFTQTYAPDGRSSVRSTRSNTALWATG